MEHTHDHLQEAIDVLKHRGVRITPQRRAILNFLIEAHTHPTADEIYKALAPNYPNMSVATVYNNLHVFKDAGIVKELSYGDVSSRFDFASHEHYHAICDNCGKIVDFSYPGLEEVESLAAHVTGFAISRHRLEVYGLCDECKKKV
ncbi:peroxide-responsive transcriptional repressor PerR [Brochothrix campestris]|uniref:Ferric uptake regulator family protein n=1 Tax=Brochothrix campestris FSL F6-1037 TaxID=1265861 RepID=W7CH40_9LIST|nr:peroxide-responsive transcriptional repressor PerR [Brochothrix campestris]EUJ36265.1 ferric uptake regulator family protein [Brochothrix campestris FSL F6-1037]